MGVARDVQTFLAMAAIVDGATGWPSVRRRVHDETDQIVVITEDGGPLPGIGKPDGLAEAAKKDPAVQVFVRGTRWDGDGPQAKAAEVFDALHGLTSATVGANDYLRVRAMTAQPVFIGYDENGRAQFTCSYSLMRDV